MDRARAVARVNTEEHKPKMRALDRFYILYDFVLNVG